MKTRGLHVQDLEENILITMVVTTGRGSSGKQWFSVDSTRGESIGKHVNDTWI